MSTAVATRVDGLELGHVQLESAADDGTTERLPRLATVWETDIMDSELVSEARQFTDEVILGVAELRADQLKSDYSLAAAFSLVWYVSV
mmetsp:Transcript_2639/g.5124  ORF Transcript_2639/g.5124 Transcript_2639/m.5124 type:complete len:89 (-) Transcript_2639:511-777(-)